MKTIITIILLTISLNCFSQITVGKNVMVFAEIKDTVETIYNYRKDGKRIIKDSIGIDSVKIIKLFYTEIDNSSAKSDTTTLLKYKKVYLDFESRKYRGKVKGYYLPYKSIN